MLMQLRSNRKQAVELYSKATTTAYITTVSTAIYGSAFSCAGYNVGTVITRVVANASGAPKVQLEGSVDGTTYAVITTLNADITTTANNKGAIVEGLTPYVRVAVTSGATATTHLLMSVKMMKQVCV